VPAARAAAAAERLQLEASTATQGRYIESAVTVGAVEHVVSTAAPGLWSVKPLCRRHMVRRALPW